MREDELEGRVEAQEFLFLFHYQVVRPLRVIAVGLVILSRIGPAASLVNREVTVVDFIRGFIEIDLCE